ncbi:addiction module protein [Methylobacter sp. Wu8]|uniref:Putative addiction module component (TIGR02574 family) n=1 Tax=Methylobacter tundripaludum TaxID=173365 RepID=A0A2S6GNV4_9GAMM|nr:addiction module protein [Methylobacter tundripaludum]MCK9638250.1 addiction module protein [Methylobacter tundripaludum]PPK66914.1 putative addiction module component (TIGR02574 family) [Methylobacter tundripaludum]
MNQKQLFDQALSLPLADRAALAEQLLASLDQPDPQMDELIAIEAERRIDAYDNGKMRSIPAHQVFSRLESN